MTVEIGPYLEAIVLPTVKDVARKWAGYVEEADLIQEAALWWYGEAQPYLAEYVTADAAYVRLRRSIWRACATYASREKAAQVGYYPDDQYAYRPDLVAQLLPVALDPQGLPDGGGVADLAGVRVHGNLAEGGNVLAHFIDVKRAIEALSDEDRDFLATTVEFHEEWERIGRIYEIEPDSARRRHTRITERLARWLNKEVAA